MPYLPDQITGEPVGKRPYSEQTGLLFKFFASFLCPTPEA